MEKFNVFDKGHALHQFFSFLEISNKVFLKIKSLKKKKKSVYANNEIVSPVPIVKHCPTGCGPPTHPPHVVGRVLGVAGGGSAGRIVPVVGTVVAPISVIVRKATTTVVTVFVTVTGRIVPANKMKPFQYFILQRGEKHCNLR